MHIDLKIVYHIYIEKNKMETYEIYELLQHEINADNEELLEKLNTDCKYDALNKLNFFCAGSIRELYESLNDKQICLI